MSLNQEKSIGNSSKFDGDFISLDCFVYLYILSGLPKTPSRMLSLFKHET